MRKGARQNPKGGFINVIMLFKNSVGGNVSRTMIAYYKEGSKIKVKGKKGSSQMHPKDTA